MPSGQGEEFVLEEWLDVFFFFYLVKIGKQSLSGEDRKTESIWRR